MRERRTFAERTKVLKTSEAKRKFFLVFEGAKTEGIYFDAVNKLRSQISIDPLIELVPLVRSYSESDWSNPEKIINRLIVDVEADITGEIPCEMVLNRIMDYFIESGILNSARIGKKVIWEQMVMISQKQFGYSLNGIVRDIREFCEGVLEYLYRKIDIPQIVDDISEIIMNGGLGYEDGYDKVCLVVDRDSGSFTEAQYDSVFAKCVERNIGLFVSNPCFEFWLLLHFDAVFSLDKEKLISNPKVTSSKRYTEHELTKLLPRYCKSSYNAEGLIKNVDVAIKHAESFCENIELLKNELGSNIGKLITCLRENCDGSNFSKVKEQKLEREKD